MSLVVNRAHVLGEGPQSLDIPSQIWLSLEHVTKFGRVLLYVLISDYDGVRKKMHTFGWR